MEIATNFGVVLVNERLTRVDMIDKPITFRSMTDTQKECIERSNLCTIGNYARDVYSSKEDIPKEYITCTHKSTDSKFYTFDVSVVSPDGNRTDSIKIDRGLDTICKVAEHEKELIVPRQSMKSLFPKELTTIDLEDIINGAE